jgi:hypothetical protein
MNAFDDLPEIIIVPMEDELYHTAENGYCCGDPTCYCAGDNNQTDPSLAAEPPLDTIGMLN